MNLAEKELREFGIHNSFHLRKLAVIMNSYRKRYERRKALKEGRGNGSVLGDEEDEEDGMLSEYAPSGTHCTLLMVIHE